MKIMLFFFFVLSVWSISFEGWESLHGKHFGLAERLRRRAIFHMNSRIVENLNSKKKFRVGMEGPYAALTSLEYQKMLNKYIEPPTNIQSDTFQAQKKNIPDSLDWRTYGYVTPVKDQGSCGSCYIFGAVATVESRLLMTGTSGYTSDTLDLSEQQVLNCIHSVRDGCNGGTLQATYSYIKNNGIMEEKDEKYIAQSKTCQEDLSLVKVTIGGMRTADISDKALTETIADGPVGVCIDASQPSFQLYKSGVYDEPNCKKLTNHCLSAVGYGTLDGDDYYIIKNSWGVNWGLDGYILMSRNKNDQCGICTSISYPVDVKLI
ncbi:cysteine proteinase 1 precursor, putative [Entamoeba invadens IP1]|uniref:cysteine proteinase 1 precursor, putative n=1 Tax=Entamoeba invadens IP1 TaxID=370355 RepID=UPI0002C3E297|nr:cysteine proteinase 1 precursor, putative [Entamoeba invadens IP1]ELP93317.1 cysteine proteinase 1 precursor, putative [Entamoeba invadens IP1]|eukprot:XP_004260088.1 cysteine proteinase 1 precursor, putative [Entamoeba invadens IP1]